MRAFVTGSTGYIGSRLIPALLEKGHAVIAGMRDPDRAAEFSWGDLVEVRRFDLQDPGSLSSAVAGADIAYFLVHSMAGKDFREQDATGARAFATACEREGVGRIVYLSGLIPGASELSEHLASRLEVEQILLDGAVPARVLRAAVIIGAGSTSFELIRRLVERLPALPIPGWMNRLVQPVATQDVVAALVDAANGDAVNGHEDLGGPDRLAYPELVAMIAEELRVPRPQLSVPWLPSGLLGRVAAQVTGIPENTVVQLVRSLRHDMVCDDAAPTAGRMPVRESIRRSLDTAHTGTEIHGDPQTADGSDPEWAGGEIGYEDGTRVLDGRGLSGLLRGTAPAPTPLSAQAATGLGGPVMGGASPGRRFAAVLVPTAAAVTAAAAVGTIATAPGSLWYRRLRKPAWQPPSSVFPLVWTPLYAGIAVTSAAVLHRLREHEEAEDPAGERSPAQQYGIALGVNLVLNAGWSVVFWRGRSLTAATVECAVLTASSADLARRAATAHPLLGASLVPYAAWTGFATGLSAALLRRNR